MKRVTVMLAVVALAGCRVAAAPESQVTPPNQIGDDVANSLVERVVDERYGVICYVSDGYKSGGISCLPIPSENSP